MPRLVVVDEGDRLNGWVQRRRRRCDWESAEEVARAGFGLVSLRVARGSAVLLTRQNLIVDERLDKHRAPLVRREAGAVGGGRCYQGQKQEHSVVVVGEELGQSVPWYDGTKYEYQIQ